MRRPLRSGLWLQVLAVLAVLAVCGRGHGRGFGNGFVMDMGVVMVIVGLRKNTNHGTPMQTADKA